MACGSAHSAPAARVCPKALSYRAGVPALACALKLSAADGTRQAHYPASAFILVLFSRVYSAATTTTEQVVTGAEGNRIPVAVCCGAQQDDHLT